MNIIIVEDEGITALHIKEAITALNHKVINIFDNGDNLLDFLSTNCKVDLIFMDIQINGSMDGIEVSKEIYKKYPHIFIVFITSFKDSDTIKSSQLIYPKGYLIKPISDFDIEAILMVIESENRKQTVASKIYINTYIYDKKSKNLYDGEYIILFSKNEKICFEQLIKNMNSYVSPEQLILEIWGYKEEQKISSLRELVYRLRKKISNISIKSSSNLGYMLINT